MSLNLVRDAWIPVTRRSGARDIIAPHQILEMDDPPVEIDAPRPDFRGALLEFMIGLFNTAMLPKDRGEWTQIFRSPPDPAEALEFFSGLIPAFNVSGDGPRVFQDFETDFGSDKRVEQMLIEAPGDNTLKKNLDFFVKRDESIIFGERGAAMAMITRQIYDNGLGGGYRSSLRGPGPVTTVVLADTLWRTIWLNGTTSGILGGADPVRTPDPDVFPWLAPPRTSDGDKPPVTPADIHPLGVFWPCGGRYRLKFDQLPESRKCTLTGDEIDFGSTTVEAAQYGPNYEGPFIHPLSPRVVKSPDDVTYRRGRDLSGGGMTYKNWAGFAVADSSENYEPARVVELFHQDRRSRDLGQRTPRIRCFGYHTSQASAMAWNEMVMPILAYDEDQSIETTRLEAERWIALSEDTQKTIMNQLRKALYGRPPTAGSRWSFPGDSSSLYGTNVGDEVIATYWTTTEPPFYEGILDIAEHDSKIVRERREEWLRKLSRSALEIFDRYVAIDQIANLDTKAVAMARVELQRFLSPRAKKRRAALQLPKLEKEK